MKRRSAPPLYELIRSRSGERQAAARGAVERPEPDDPGEPIVARWLQPGRCVQLPVGYLFVAGAVVLLLAALSYMVGHSRGYDAAKVAQADELDAAHGYDETRRPRDPLERQSTSVARQPLSQQSPQSPQSQTQRQPAGNQRPASGGARRDTTIAAPASQWGPIESDPRQSGMNYFILATTNPDGAMRLAEYCRERGLETYVISSNNARLRRVIALPGFEAGQRTSQAAREVEALIHRIGETWSRTEPGATNLRDAYPERYGG